MTKQGWKVSLGEQIRAARELRKISQLQLAKRVRRRRASIISYENGTGNPEFRVVAKIAALLKADFKVLGCRIIAEEILEPRPEQLELAYDQDYSLLATVTIKPTKKSMTITAHSDYGPRTA